jgi:hypothetical protein
MDKIKSGLASNSSPSLRELAVADKKNQMRRLLRDLMRA